MSREGDRGIANDTRKPIQKLQETETSMFNHLATQSNQGEPSSPRFSLKRFQGAQPSQGQMSQHSHFQNAAPMLQLGD